MLKRFFVPTDAKILDHIWSYYTWTPKWTNLILNIFKQWFSRCVVDLKRINKWKRFIKHHQTMIVSHSQNKSLAKHYRKEDQISSVWRPGHFTHCHSVTSSWFKGLPQQCNPIDLTTHHFAIYHVQISWSCTSGDRQLAISARLAFFNPRSSFEFLRVTYERVRWYGVGQKPLSSILDTIWLINSLPWKDPAILKFGEPSISMDHLYHGYVK